MPGVLRPRKGDASLNATNADNAPFKTTKQLSKAVMEYRSVAAVIADAGNMSTHSGSLCDASMLTLDTYLKDNQEILSFCRLPPEIRVNIWNLCLAEIDTPRKLVLPSKIPAPAIFHVNAESRNEALRSKLFVRMKTFNDEHNRSILMYINPAKDTLIWGPEKHTKWPQQLGDFLQQAALSKVQHLAMSAACLRRVVNSTPTDIILHGSLQATFNSTRLKTVTVWCHNSGPQVLTGRRRNQVFAESSSDDDDLDRDFQELLDCYHIQRQTLGLTWDGEMRFLRREY